uniref:Uncharacterized protein n=1 Tax=Candidatus Methanogaster sp. ANME-2c ERB4 TaxID=2759911 RepID=A0A7G9YJP6_9EURY|nr:hypothetical protein APENILPF_00015 [Methanosarcinales archaeon ANME-2c ERB4]QNO42037.1 hypothetical protein GKLMMCAD_00015 [Methanosarcinales archaeon ANME-2c ERB4]QNO42665.1 hypothetical protein LNAFDGMD_00026 [Methanosarcinales archaeon ANME-2c ERB4]QNO43392.1 hypothetical protein PNFJDKBC_00003 [Methanosarcinales archaeon ANME-2c ERB4]QNO48230.1 hypothetical protein BHCKGNAA_00015 [Methanosarcinales archaeon ANME-2c ERB4]
MTDKLDALESAHAELMVEYVDLINQASNLTFKDVLKNTIGQPNQCMTYQNINPLAIDFPNLP